MLKVQQILCNEDGENVLKDYFDSISLKGQYIIVKKNNLIGIYDGVTFFSILKCEWEKVVLDRNYFVATKGPQIGVFDYLGNNILKNSNWDNVKLFDYGVLVTKNGKQGFIKYDGTILLDCIWKRIEPYNRILLAYQGNGAKRIKFRYDGTRVN